MRSVEGPCTWALALAIHLARVSQANGMHAGRFTGDRSSSQSASRDRRGMAFLPFGSLPSWLVKGGELSGSGLRVFVSGFAGITAACPLPHGLSIIPACTHYAVYQTGGDALRRVNGRPAPSRLRGRVGHDTSTPAR